MMSSRLLAFRAMVAKSPDNALARFGLANEAFKEKLFEEARENYEAYLAASNDEGNAYGKLGDALSALDRPDEAKAAYRRGIEAATRHGHPGMASELESKLEEMENA